MSMPASGNIGMLSTPQGGCSSISLAACGNATPPKSFLALAAAAGKPACASAFYSYDDSLVITPTTIISIPAAGATCSVSACAPAFNTFIPATSCTWLHPAGATPPSPSGVAQNITIDVNAGGARCGTVTYTPTCGGVQTVTLCQLSATKAIMIRQISTTGCGAAITCATIGFCSSITMSSSDCFCLCLVGGLFTTGQGANSCACYKVCCNGTTQCYICSILSNTFTTSIGYSIMVTCANISCICVTICAVTTAAGCAGYSSAYANISCVTSVAGSFCVGSPSSCCMCTC
jgi:hypothetical protein